MRFITEFELHLNTPDDVIEAYKSRYCYDLGYLIAEQFGWNETAKNMNDRYSLEIEAFPMDKWIEFKKDLFTRLSKDGVLTMHVIEMIKELESFGTENNKKSKTIND